MHDLPPGRSDDRSLGAAIWAQTALVFGGSLALLHQLLFRSAFIAGYDGYYHAKYALLLRERGLFREFPWAAHSVWAEQFADKELLYHVLLIPFTAFGDPIAGVKAASVLLGALVLASFYLILKLNHVRYAFVWYLLLLGSGGLFVYRLCACRPHVLSMLLLLWSVHLMLKRRLLPLAVVSFVYSLSYTGFHLSLMLAVILAAHAWLAERRVEWKTSLTIFASMAVGMLVNPYFPNNLRIFWLQNFAVPWMSLQSEVDLGMAHEFAPLTGRALLLDHAAIVVPLLGAFYLALARPRTADARTRSLFVLSVSLIVPTLMISRFVEYAVPVTLLFLATFYDRQLAGVDPPALLRRRGRERLVVVAAGLLVAGFVAAVIWRTYADAVPRMQAVEPPLREAALYLAEHARPDELVFTCDWDDTPSLFYYNHANRYPVFMDPSFMYFWDPGHWREWTDVANGRFGGRSYDMLAERYEIGVCSWDFTRLKWIVENDPRMEVVFDSPGGWVFRIDRDNPDISLDQFMYLSPSEEEAEARMRPGG